MQHDLGQLRRRGRFLLWLRDVAVSWYRQSHQQTESAETEKLFHGMPPRFGSSLIAYRGRKLPRSITQNSSSDCWDRSSDLLGPRATPSAMSAKRETNVIESCNVSNLRACGAWRA